MGSTALQLECNALICYAAKGDLEAVTCLIEGQVSGRADIREMTLVRKRFPPDMVGLYGDTPLHAAANNGHVEVVDLLLKSLADPSAQNDMGQTPLVCASMQGHDKVVSRLLVSDQVDARRLTIDGKNALSVAASSDFTRHLTTGCLFRWREEKKHRFFGEWLEYLVRCYFSFSDQGASHCTQKCTQKQANDQRDRSRLLRAKIRVLQTRHDILRKLNLQVTQWTRHISSKQTPAMQSSEPRSHFCLVRPLERFVSGSVSNMKRLLQIHCLKCFSKDCKTCTGRRVLCVYSALGRKEP